MVFVSRTLVRYCPWMRNASFRTEEPDTELGDCESLDWRSRQGAMAEIDKNSFGFLSQSVVSFMCFLFFLYEKEVLVP